MSNLIIQLNAGNAAGSCFGGFLVKSKTKFSWEEGRVFAEKELDDAIYRHNLLIKAEAKRIGKQMTACYQWLRAGPVVKCLRGPCREPQYYPTTKWEQNTWFCTYRYKAQEGTSEEYIKSLWWHKPGPSKSKAELQRMDMGESQDEPLY